MPPPHPPQHSTSRSTTRTTGYAAPAPAGHLVLARANAPFAPGAPPSSGSNRKQSKSAKTKPSKQLSKSLSTPQLRDPIMSDSDLDKKRNKLGYQRISIACAHCRRRKIRCLSSEDESEQRCQNCIRLKKECVFYPVDQQAAMDATSDASSRTGPSEPSSAVSSSPQQGGARTFEPQGHSFGGFQNLPPGEPVSYQGIPIAPSGTLPSQGTYVPQEYGYSSQGDNSAPWSPHQYNSQNHALPVSSPASMHYPYARYVTPSMTADTAPFPGSVDHSQHSASYAEGFSYTPEQAQQQWQQQPPPGRSMSYSGYPNNYNSSFHANQLPPGSYMRQQSMLSQHSDPHHVSMAPPHVPSLVHQHPSYMMPPHSRGSSVQGVPMYSTSHQMQPNWYPDAQSLGQENEVARTHGTLPSNSDQRGYSTRPT